MPTAHQGQSNKQERRIRLDGDLKQCLPVDIHSRLTEQKSIERYPTLWSTAQRAIDLGLSVMEARQNITPEIVTKVGINTHNAGQERF